MDAHSTNPYFLRSTINENTAYQDLSDASVVVLRRKFIALYACIKKEERSQINNLNFLP